MSTLPAYAEPPQTDGVGQSPPFPPGIKPGKRPGTHGDDDDDTVVVPTPSTIGGAAAGIGYLLAGVTTFLALRAVPGAFRLAGRGLREFLDTAENRRKYGEVGAAVERWEAAKAGRFAELEGAYAKYTSAYAALDNHIERLVNAPSQPRGVALQLLDDHVAKLLTDIPMLSRAKAGLKDQATALVGEWAKVRGTDGARPSKPLDDWLRTNDGEYFLKTTKGRDWLAEYRRLRDQGLILQEGKEAATSWKTKGSIADLERWLARHKDRIDAEIIKDWAETYGKLKDRELAEAKALSMDLARVVRECGDYFSNPDLKEALEKAKASAPVIPNFGIERPGEVREPGIFYLYDGDNERTSVTRGDLTSKAKEHCNKFFAHLQNVAALAKPMGFMAKGLRLAAPAAALGLAGTGGYFSAQGVEHYWDKAFPKKDPKQK